MKIASLLLIFTFGILAGSDPQYKIGDKVKDFSLTNVTDNKTVSLSNYSDKKSVVIIFNSFSCPYSKIYEDRIIQLAREYESSSVAFLIVNSQNTELEDQPSSMAQRASEKKYSFPFLADPAKTVARQFSATRTPEAFVLKNLNGNFILLYRGAIDDNPQAATQVTRRYLQEAIQAVITDGPVLINEKRATGCVIK